MNEALEVRAYRFVYGKVVARPGGPVEPGFEHRPTSVSSAMPKCLLAYCRPVEPPDRDAQIPSPFDDETPEPVQLHSTSPTDLVRPDGMRDGALYFAPCSCGGRRYMVATCLRARPELGDSGLGRTHTQLVSFVFTELDWNRHAPRLLANAGRWLRAEPDLIEFHNRGDYPTVELGPELLPECPPCEQGLLPTPGTLLWRLAAALENNTGNLLIGAADRIDSVATFLRALACTAALLPRPLRIYLTAAAGFRQTQKPFAIQYLPDASAMPGADPGFFQQVGERLLMAEPEADQQRWQDYWEELSCHDKIHAEAMRDLIDPPYPKGGEAARNHLATAIDKIAAEHSVNDLVCWLDGKRPNPPPRPAMHYPRTGAEWISTLSRRLNEEVAETGEPKATAGATRALSKLTTLIDTGGDKRILQRQALYWADAWLSAAKQTSGTNKLDRDILRWSSLGASPLLERTEGAAGAKLGRFQDFSELRAISEAVRRARAETPDSMKLVNTALSSRTFNRRLQDLRSRADRVLIRHPRSLIDLAASFPALLKPKSGDDRFQADSVAQTIAALRLTALLYHWTGRSPPPVIKALGNAARTCADASFGPLPANDNALKEHLEQHPDSYLIRSLGRYWQWALAPDDDRDLDHPVWCDAVRGILEYLIPKLGVVHATNLLRRTYQPAYDNVRDTLADRNKIETASMALIDAGLDALAPSTANSMDTAVGLLRAIPDPTALADNTVPFHAFAEALWQRLLDAVDDWRTATAPHALSERLLPVFATILKRAGQTDGAKPLPAVTWRLLDLFDRLLKRWLKSGTPPRAAVLDIFEQLEELTARTAGVPNEWGVLPGVDPRLPEAIISLSVTSGDCLIAWAYTDPPEPWWESSRPLNTSPIRCKLAQGLGFPQCVYFGGLILPSKKNEIENIKKANRSMPVDQSSDLCTHLRRSRDRYDRVIAHGASKCWLNLFSGTHLDRGDLNALMKKPESNQALQAIADLINTATNWSATIDPETGFTVAFFVGLNDPALPAAHMNFPPTLKEVLLSNGSKHATSYPMHLGRLIANGTSNLRLYLRQVFEAQEKSRTFTTRVLQLPERGWTDFRSLDADQKRFRMLRVLFTLGLIFESRPRQQPAEHRLPVDCKDIWNAMQIADASAKDAVANFLNHHTNKAYPTAFREAIKRAGLNKLPGWPDAVQPD